MTRTTPQLAPPIQTSMPHQRGDVWPLRMILRATGPIHGGSLVESGFEPGPFGPKAGTLPLGHRGLPNKPKGEAVDKDLLSRAPIQLSVQSTFMYDW
ncbi:hypothetical protein AVEN_174841-1 [Araneus ventricosus]|uniref:Uncharacterized protein n=1 Tax=Araneus ventricosus TaxID=182803 RepID=A0A4Y2SN58_ARAVE|nr:hypothetical protein AVEN_125660-1 [Araneus ventricosus]GBN89672.1 hypothetical protein AVEN_258144-1 [Araneus ventricosus]GBN89702.1 hypothetical protein AVEN_212071-1 [Araneus ventricosus]GBN89708.1 hypothetical protein AVEN_174841-1 [Araneus ventricosus]